MASIEFTEGVELCSPVEEHSEMLVTRDPCCCPQRSPEESRGGVGHPELRQDPGEEDGGTLQPFLKAGAEGARYRELCCTDSVCVGTWKQGTVAPFCGQEI